MTTLLMGMALGMRHGTDPDHLTAIDGFDWIDDGQPMDCISHLGTASW